MAERKNQQDIAREASEVKPQGGPASIDASRQALEGGAQQMAQTGQQLLQAAEVYSDTARRLADEIRTLMSVPTSAAGGVQDLTHAWTNWLSRAVEANTRFSQEILRARSLPRVA
jgi:hypothetical protein